jgi:Type IV pili methyl-accepting chemotaxis transducer N-term
MPKANRVFRLLWLLCIVVSTGYADLAFAAEPAPAAQLINVSGRQRMLTQRIVKAYVQVGLGITPEVSRRQLHDAVRLFENQLGRLKRSMTDSQSRQALAGMEKQWQGFRKLALGPVARGNVETLMGMGEALLSAAHELTLALQSRSAMPSAKLVDVSGRQRMLSQRMAKYYLAHAWGVQSAADGRELGSARAEFEGALVILRDAPQNTPQIKKELEAVAAQWEWFKSALTQEGAASYGLVVAHASESILNSMELVTSFYEKLD